MYMGKQLKSIHSIYANRFFNSFKSFKIAEKPVNWVAFKHDTGAFSIKFPSQPKRINQQIKNPKKDGQPFKINMLVATDTAQLATYVLRYNDYPEGNYIADRNILFDGMGKELAGKAKIIGSPKKIWKDGYEGRELNMIFEGGYYGVIRAYIRGNRIYVLLKENLHQGEKTDANDPFFNSFTFTPFSKVTYVDFKPDGENFKIKLPAQPKNITDTTEDFKSYLKKGRYYSSTSPASGGVYTVEHYDISKYYRLKHIDSLYKNLTNILISRYTDTVLKVDTVIMNSRKAREIIGQNKTTHDQRRFRILVDDGEVYILQSHIACKELFSEESNTFYTSFERTVPAMKADLISSKADKITTDLQSADTTVQKEALGALSYYKFTTDELPYVYAAMKKNYTDDTLSFGTRYELVGALNKVHDEKTTDELQKLYSTLQDKDLLKSEVLRTIPAIDPKKNYDIYFNLLITDTAAHFKYSYVNFEPLYDSLKYAADHFQQLVPLVPNRAYRNDILALSEVFLKNKNEAYHKLVKDNFKLLTAYAMDELNEFLTSKDTNKSEWNNNIYKYFTLMSDVKGEPLTNKFTSSYLAYNPKSYGTSTAVIARINNHLPTSAILIKRLLDSIDTRYDIMQALYKQKQADKIPIKYKTQQEFARLCFYQYVSSSDDDDDHGVPSNIRLLGTVTDKGMLYYAFKYHLGEEDSDKTYIGIAGPYKSGSTALNFDKLNAFTNYDVKETNWIKQAEKLIPDLIKAYKSN